jgi:hypothetical protein
MIVVTCPGLSVRQDRGIHSAHFRGGDVVRADRRAAPHLAQV